MPFSASDFFSLYFEELERRKIPAVVLHSYQNFPEKITTDVDYAVRNEDLPHLPAIQRVLAERHGWLLAHTIEAHIHARYTVVIDPENPAEFLQLDACGHYVEENCLLLRDSALLNNRSPFRNFFVPAPEIEFAYLLAKALAKNKPVASCLPRLQELRQHAPAATGEQFRRLFGNANGALPEWLQQPAADWEKLRARLLEQHRFDMANRCREWRRAVKRIFHPTGLHLTIQGADAGERSRLLAQIEPLITGPFFRRAKFDIGAGAARSYFSELRHYFLKILPARVRNELVLGDRPSGALLPRPDLTIALDFPVDNATRNICGQVIRFLAEREKRRAAT